MYLGTQPSIGQNRKLDSIASSFNSVLTTFNLTVNTQSVVPSNVYQLFISLGGVLQNPGVDFTVNGNQITFTTAPTTGLSFFGIFQGDSITGTPTIADASITTLKLATGLTVTHTAGTAAAPSITFAGDTANGAFAPAANTFGISTGGTERLRLDSSGRLGLGSSSPSYQLHVASANTSSSATIFASDSGGRGLLIQSPYIGNAVGKIGISGTDAAFAIGSGSSNTTAIYIDTSQRVGIGTTSPSYTLDLNGTCRITNGTNPYIALYNGSNTGYLQVASGDLNLVAPSSGNITFTAGGSEAVRIDTSRRLLLGTSTARDNFFNTTGTARLVQVEHVGTGTGGISVVRNSNADGGSSLVLAASAGTALGSNTLVSSTQDLGQISFQGADGTEFVVGASITATVDGTPGANDLPSRLVFSTTADGASSPTERMRIASNGAISTVVPGGSTLYPAYDCRAWVNFNGTGTVAIRASGNVSSITDNNVGDYTVNFTTAMADANYSVVMEKGVTGSRRTIASYGMDGSGNSVTPTATAVRVICFDESTTATLDMAGVSVAIFR